MRHWCVGRSETERADLEGRTCNWDGCPKGVDVRGFCRAHYARARRLGVVENLPEEVHRLSHVHAETATAVCEVCGLTPIRLRLDGKASECMTVRRRNRGRGGKQSRNSRLRSIYGITLQEFEEMVRVRGGACDICGDTMSPPHVDHDHATGEVRGLLCRTCNIGIGHLRDDPRILTNAISYLARPRRTPGA